MADVSTYDTAAGIKKECTVDLQTNSAFTEFLNNNEEEHMNVPMELSWKNIDNKEILEDIIREKAAKLEHVCDYISSIRGAVEDDENQKSHTNKRVRLEITVPPGNDIVVEKKPGPDERGIEAAALIRQAFEAARRQLLELKDKQRNEVKTHPRQQVNAVVDEIMTEEDYGYIKTVDTGRRLYFHKNSVLHNDFDRLTIGTGVDFNEEQGDKGPQASSIRLVEKPDLL